LRLNKEASLTLEEHDPGMADSVTATSPEYNPSVVSHFQQLAPSPERKVFAISSLALFKFFRGLPVIPLAKQFLVRYGATFA